MQKFNWHSDPLTLSTPIDQHYKMSQNVRRFFKLHLGEDFHFNRAFMQWTKANSGKNLGEAISAYKKKML
jgi:hypothetical protein